MMDTRMSFTVQGDRVVRLYCAMSVPVTIDLPFGRGQAQTTELVSYSIERKGDLFTRLEQDDLAGNPTASGTLEQVLGLNPDFPQIREAFDLDPVTLEQLQGLFPKYQVKINPR